MSETTPEAVQEAEKPNTFIADGIYFGLDEEAYHASPSIGSTDIRKLSYSPCDYWFSSSHNPLLEPRDPTPAQNYGRAVHTRVLEGAAKFLDIYAPIDSPGNTKAGKEERAAIEEAGGQWLKRADFNRIMQAGAMIGANPFIEQAFVDGMPEVSVFWHDERGIPKKCRFDYLKERAIVDLKSIRNSRNLKFMDTCARAVGEWRYDVQALCYMDGRRAMHHLWAKEKIFGVYNREWLRDVLMADVFAFVFVFWQAENAPLTHGFTLNPGNPILESYARPVIQMAENNYLEFVEKYGLDIPWVELNPLRELDISEMPAWAFRS